jgi:hypothetical protein
MRPRGEAFNRARSLCEQLDSPPQLVTVLHGQWVRVLLAGDLALARSRAEELLTLGMERGDLVWTVMGCRISGVTCCWLGEWIAARDYLERGLLVYGSADRASYAELTIDDTHVMLLTYLAWALLCLGYLDQARASERRHWRRRAFFREHSHWLTLYQGLPMPRLSLWGRLEPSCTQTNWFHLRKGKASASTWQRQ